MSGQILVTGGGGYLGRRLAARLLAETDDRLILTVRAADRAALADTAAALRRELGQEADRSGRVDVVAADLNEENPFESVDPRAVTCVVHAAARTAFNVERSVAREVNIDGTRRVGEFARSCGKLERLLVLSTLFTCGRRVGPVREVAHDSSPGFVNHYEWSKYEAERLLLDHCADLPLSIVRLATIVADDDTGAVTQYNAFHNTLKLFFYGLLSLMPGDPATRLYLATADFTTGGVTRLVRSAAPAGVFHLAPAPEQTLRLDELIDLVFKIFEDDSAFRRRRLLRPEFCDIESFRDLVDAAKSLSAGPAALALGSVAPFAEQMFLSKDFDNGRLRAAWEGCRPSDPRHLATVTCEHLVRTRWGRSARRDLEEPE